MAVIEAARKISDAGSQLDKLALQIADQEPIFSLFRPNTYRPNVCPEVLDKLSSKQHFKIYMNIMDLGITLTKLSKNSRSKDYFRANLSFVRNIRPKQINKIGPSARSRPRRRT
jgi:hypothetical protein